MGREHLERFFAFRIHDANELELYYTSISIDLNNKIDPTENEI